MFLATYICSMTIHEAQQQLKFQLYEVYDDREAANIADWVMESITEWKRIDRIVHKDFSLLNAQVEQLQQITNSLLQHEPVQYVLGEAWFYGYKFYVNKHVLIPRPETEELVDWMITDVLDKELTVATLLDIGTGSGCIPIAIKKQLPTVEVHSCDVSEGALSVAKKNAAFMEAVIQFHHLNFLYEEERTALPVVDIVISNPPYIPMRDKSNMQKNVLEHEPHLALFVPDEDALIFYTAIADFAKTHLSAKGAIYVETHEELAQQVADVFSLSGLIQVEVKKDLQQKTRMVKARKGI
jgi:release factor glutamine methyltransferase